MENHLSEMLDIETVPLGLELLAYRGSIAHNMYIPGTDPNSIDDVDLIGFVVPPAKYVLGLSEWGTRGTKEVKVGKFDIVYYELRKAVRLLLQGNPNILGILYLQPEHYLLCTSIGRLIDERDIFLGKHVYNSFAGYAHAQLQKMETRDPAELREYIAVTNELKYRGAHPNHKGEQFDRPLQPLSLDTVDVPGTYGEERNAFETSTEKLIQKLASYHKKGENIGYMGDKRKQLVLQHGYDSKNAAHCIRLLRMCREFLLDGHMQVYRTADAAELLDIKRGKWAIEDVKTLANDLFADIKVARDKSPLPEEPDHEAAEKLVMEIYKEAYVNN